MAKLHFLVCCAVATFEAVCLVGVEVGDRGDFEPSVLGFGIDLKVVADGGRETLVTSTQTQDAVV